MEIYRIIMNFKFQISNFQWQILICCGIALVVFLSPQIIFADSAVDTGLAFLKTHQDATGKIIGGFSAPSQWSAIAFLANGKEITAVKNPTVSLKDFLRTDVPTNDAATEWETRILALVAASENPTDVAGINAVEKLEGFATAGQLGDTCALNDDIFGLLALIASGNKANQQIKQDVLSFIITNQDSDGGFSWSAPGCAWYGTSPDMTAAGLQALEAAKENGLTHIGVDGALTKATDYLLTHQNSDGGFGSFGSDADTTGWVLMAFNSRGMADTVAAQKARTWLLSTQQADGGFLSFSGTDTTTTAQALIALSGKWWILHTYTDTVEESSNQMVTPTVTLTPTPTVTMTVTPTPKPELISLVQIVVTVTPGPTAAIQKNANTFVSARTVLGAETKAQKTSTSSKTKPTIKKIIIQSFGKRNILFFFAGAVCVFLALT